MKMHKSITADRVMAACERSMTSLDNPGFCVRCGGEADGVEPDACRYVCELCGEPGVYGAEQLMLMVAL